MACTDYNQNFAQRKNEIKLSMDGKIAMQSTPKTLVSFFDELKSIHPPLLRMLVWQNDSIVLDAINPEARMDRETNLLRIVGKAFLGFMPFMRIPLSDFRGELKNVRSVTKTFTSLLAGLVFQDQINAVLDESICNFFPEISPEDSKAAIHLRHLLSNTAGFASIEDFNSMRKLFSTENWVQTILQFPLQAQAGSTYIYSSANFHLAASLLERALGASLLDFARDTLFQPLGITDFFWEQDPQGVPFGGSDLYLKPEDMLTVGLVCLDDGKWKGNHQVIPPQWLQLSTQPLVKVNEHDHYGFGWWVNHNQDEGCISTYSACGVGGQRIVIIPERKSVVVTISLTSLYSHSESLDDAICAYFSQ